MAIICYANTIDYNHPLQQRPQHLMNELAKRGHTIHWVDKTKLDHRFRTVINDNLTVYHDWDKYVKKFNGQVDIYFSSWSHRWKDIEQVKPKFTIYDSLDLFPANESEEENMVKNCDLLLTTTKNIMDFQKQHTDKEIYLCENGCFPKYRSQIFDVPKEYIGIKKPIVLFSGALAVNPINGWVDYDIIKRVASEFQLVVVGLNWDIQDNQKKELDKFGVIFTGAKTYDELQAYYKHCDVNILPFKRCQTADYSFPLKVVEGCNLGKICVATDIPVIQEFAQEFPNAIIMAKGIESFINGIKLTITKKNNKSCEKDCFDLADKHSWDKKVDTIEMLLNNIVKVMV